MVTFCAMSLIAVIVNITTGFQNRVKIKLHLDSILLLKVSGKGIFTNGRALYYHARKFFTTVIPKSCTKKPFPLIPLRERGKPSFTCCVFNSYRPNRQGGMKDLHRGGWDVTAGPRPRRPLLPACPAHPCARGQHTCVHSFTRRCTPSRLQATLFDYRPPSALGNTVLSKARPLLQTSWHPHGDRLETNKTRKQEKHQMAMTALQKIKIMCWERKLLGFSGQKRSLWRGDISVKEL